MPFPHGFVSRQGSRRSYEPHPLVVAAAESPVFGGNAWWRSGRTCELGYSSLIEAFTGATMERDISDAGIP